MYNNVSKVMACESIEQMGIGEVISEFFESNDSCRFVLGSCDTVRDYMSKSAFIPTSQVDIPREIPGPREIPSYVWHIDATLADQPEYQEGLALFRKYVDVELFFTELMNRGLDYLCFMNEDTCVIVYVPSRDSVKIQELEGEVDGLIQRLAKIPKWVRWIFNR